MKKIFTLLSFAMSLLFTVSCGLMEIEEEPAMAEVNMYFDRDTIYVMKGETFTITPVFDPDSVTLNDIYWTTSNDTVVGVSENTFTAFREGWSTVRGISVLHQIEDSCSVCVLKNWDYELPVYPYETVFYANVTVHGKPFNPETMKLYAYIGDELCGIGVQRENYGIPYVELRVGSELDGENSADPEEDPIIQLIKFRIYDKSRLIEEEVPGLVLFDGAAHGTLSNLYKIEIK